MCLQLRIRLYIIQLFVHKRKLSVVDVLMARIIGSKHLSKDILRVLANLNTTVNTLFRAFVDSES